MSEQRTVNAFVIANRERTHFVAVKASPVLCYDALTAAHFPSLEVAEKFRESLGHFKGYRWQIANYQFGYSELERIEV